MSVFIIVGALAFALSTRVRGIVWSATQCIFSPFEDPNPFEPPRRMDTTPSPSLPKSKIPWAWRSIHKDRKRDEEDETDFWIDHRAKQENYKYNIPVLNRWAVSTEKKKKKVGRK